MDTSPKILSSFRRFLIQGGRGVMWQALRWLWRSLAFSAFFSKLRSLCQLPPKITANLPPQYPGSMLREQMESSDGHKKRALTLDIDCIPVANGGVVSRRDIMPSLDPHAGDGLHNTDLSSENLEVSASAHSCVISLTSRNPSRQSLNGSDSQYAGSAHSNSSSFINVNVIAPQDSPTNDAEDVAFADNHIDSGQSPYFQPINAISRSLLSPLSTHRDDLSRKISLAHDNKESGSTLLYRNVELEVEVDRSLKSSGRSVFSWDISPNPSYSYSPLFTPGSGLPLVLGSALIIPIMPEAIPRYTDRPVISRSGSNKTTDILPLTKKFDRPKPPRGWEKCIHPEGACYFFNPVKRVFAEANLHDDSIYTYAMKVIGIIENFIASHDIKEIDNDSELVIHISKDAPGPMSTWYYFVDHEARSIFFLDVYGLDNLSVWNQIYSGSVSESHLSHEIEAQYWCHCQNFPHSSTLTKEKIQELRDIVMHYIGDTMTSPKFTTAPFSLEELRNILELTNHMDQNVGGMSVGTHSCFARLMCILSRTRFLHFHGEPHARIDRTTSVYGDDVYRRTWLVKILSPILFCAPDIHLKDLQSMWVDEMITKPVFEETMERMNRDRDRIVLFATVVLNANVAFLAIQSVDNIGHPQRSAAQIASYVSMISSIGSIVIGLVLSRQNRTKLRETVDEFEQYMSDRHHPTLGLETLAILYSLPYALLMWGMVSFLLAVTFLCFMESDIPTVSVAGVSGSFCVMLIFWCVYTNWEKGNNEGDASSETHVGRRLYALISHFLSFLTLGRQR